MTTTATGPIVWTDDTMDHRALMARAYVDHRPDIQSITTACNDDGALAMVLSLALPHRALHGRKALARQHAHNWTPTPARDSGAVRPLLLATASILLPVPDAELPGAPTRDPGTDLTSWAKRAVKHLAVHTTAHAQPLLDALLSEAPW